MYKRQEKDRYLEDCINHAFTFLNEIFVYDDRSTDGSAELAMDLGCRVVRRPDSRPSFLNHEGKFRYAAWRLSLIHICTVVVTIASYYGVWKPIGAGNVAPKVGVGPSDDTYQG